MPTNRKENIVFGISICVIMVFFMGLLNISIHLGGFNLNSIKTCLIAFPVTFIIAYVLETFIVGRINGMLLAYFVSKKDSKNAYILFNCFFIVTMMSLLMTIVGGLLGGDTLQTVLGEFFIRWPRNFCAAFFLNILVAGPVSRTILKAIQKNSVSDSNIPNVENEESI